MDYNSKSKTELINIIQQLDTKLIDLDTKLIDYEEGFYKVFRFNLVPMGIFDPVDGTVLEVNDSFLKITGFSSRDEVIGKTAIDVFLEPEHYYQLLALIMEKGSFSNIEMTYRKKTGVFGTSLGSAELFNYQGKECILGVMMDITEKKQIEQEMARLDRLNLVGEMAASLGHEVRNPMTVVRGYLQLLLEKENFHGYQEQFNLMVDELDRANAIIKEFLYLAKDKALDLRELNLNSIVIALFQLLQAEALLTDKVIEISLGNIPLVEIDEKDVTQLILNLAMNGLEAMEPKGKLIIKTRNYPKQVAIIVRDQGKGIDPAILEKIGTPFVTSKEDGVGLGLAVCYSVAARNNAKIDVETGPEGTTFIIRFPKKLENK